MKTLENLIQKLSDLRGISGFEYRISQEIAEMFRPYADEVFVDTLGSVIAVRRSKAENPQKIMIEAHCDEIGLMVQDIDERGFISFVNIGGVDPRILPAAEVVVHGRTDLPGVIGAKPPHLMQVADGKKAAKLKDMAIDTGLPAETVREFVRVGDSITLAQSVGKLAGIRFSGKTMDDRAGVAALLSVFQNLRTDPGADVYALVAVQEEVGLRGAKTAAYNILPDVAIAVDVCHGITPDNSENAFEIGSGTVISVGPNIHPKISNRLTELAETHKIPYSVDVDGGDTGTDAWAIQVARTGIATGLLSIPLRYMHTAVETLDIKDVQATADLLGQFIQEFDTDLEGWLCY